MNLNEIKYKILELFSKHYLEKKGQPVGVPQALDRLLIQEFDMANPAVMNCVLSEINILKLEGFLLEKSNGLTVDVNRLISENIIKHESLHLTTQKQSGVSENL